MSLKADKRNFAKHLLKWNREQNMRKMPWKGEKNPYFIWLSEIILQQTRVEQGLPYYLQFKQKFPTVKKLADAPEDEIMRSWQGLGYYSRARNLHHTAQKVAYDLKGIFPTDYEGLSQLKGVGSYTAAAIASFAYNEAKAVVDGNVIRVLARVFGISTAFDTTAGKKEFAQLADELLDKQQPGLYNQAIMDFGAVVCTPQKPACTTCPFKKTCVAFTQQKTNELPVKEKKLKIKERYFHYLLLTNGKEIAIAKRTARDIWQNLYELPLIETPKPRKKPDKSALLNLGIGAPHKIVKQWEEQSQMLSHQKIHFRFTQLSAANFDNVKKDGFQLVSIKKLKQYAFPKTIHLFLKQNSLL